jgi:hypothetical protein
MKKIIVLFFILGVSICSQAQDNAEKYSKWDVGVQINTIDKFSQYENSFETFNTNTSQGLWKSKSFSCGIFGCFNLKENVCLRFKAGITNFGITHHRDDRDEYSGTAPIAYRINDEKITQIRYCFVPGILWKIKATSLFEIHGGFEMPFSIYKDYRYTGNETDYDTTSAITLKADYVMNAPGGYSIGVGGVVGFNVSLCKKISVGADFSAALIYLKLGGDIIQTYNQSVPISDTNTSHYLFKVQGMNYSGERLSINSIYSF